MPGANNYRSMKAFSSSSIEFCTVLIKKRLTLVRENIYTQYIRRIEFSISKAPSLGREQPKVLLPNYVRPAL